MWKILLLLMAMMFAFLMIRKQEKKNPRNDASKQLVDPNSIADIFGEDLLDLSVKNSR